MLHTCQQPVFSYQQLACPPCACHGHQSTGTAHGATGKCFLDTPQPCSNPIYEVAREYAHRVDADDQKFARGIDGGLGGEVDGGVPREGVGPGLARVQLVPEGADLGVAHPYDGVLPLQRLLQPCQSTSRASAAQPIELQVLTSSSIPLQPRPVTCMLSANGP